MDQKEVAMIRGTCSYAMFYSINLNIVFTIKFDI